MKSNRLTTALLAGIFWLSLALLPITTSAHCDTMDGPVIADAHTAISAKDITPVLKWVSATNEAEIRTLFEKTLAVRELNESAREMADQLFFETLVRVHRAGEGEPFTGVKPEGTAVDPVIGLVDRALSGGSIDDLIGRMNEHLTASIRERFERARSAREQAAGSVEAGREYVAAYVELMHFMERIHTDVSSDISESGHNAKHEAGH